MKYINISLVLVCILFESCNTKEHPWFPKDIRKLEVKSISHSRGSIIANDTIIIAGNFFRSTPFNMENRLLRNLHVGDIVLNPKHTEVYIDIVKKKTLDTIRYYKPLEVNGEWQLAK